MMKIFTISFLTFSVSFVAFALFSFFLNFSSVAFAANFGDLPNLFQKAKTTIEDSEKKINQNQALKILLEKNSSLKNLISSAKDFVDNFNAFTKSLVQIDEKTKIFSNPESFKTFVNESLNEIKNIIEEILSGADYGLLFEAKENFDSLLQLVSAISDIQNAVNIGQKTLTALDNLQKSYNEAKSSLNLKNIKINFELTVSGKKKLEDIVKGGLENLYQKFKKEVDQAAFLIGRIALCETEFKLDPGCVDKSNLIKELEGIIKTTLPKAFDELINYITNNLKIETSFNGFSDFAEDISVVLKITNIKIKTQQSGTEINFSLEGVGVIGGDDKVQWIIKYNGKQFDFDTLNPKLSIAQFNLLQNLYAQVSPPPLPSSIPNSSSNSTPPSVAASISAQAVVIKADNNQPLMIGGLNEDQIDQDNNQLSSAKDDCERRYKYRGQACTAINGQHGRCNYIPNTSDLSLWCKPVFNDCKEKSVDDECEIDGKQGKCADYQKPELLCIVVGDTERPSKPKEPSQSNSPSQMVFDQDCKNGILENGGLIPCRGTAGCPCTFCHFFYLIQKIINFVTLKLIPTIAILLIIIGGGMYLFNFGNTNRVRQGTDILIGVAIGILIIYAAWLIINTILIAFVNPEAIKDFPERWFSITCPVK